MDEPETTASPASSKPVTWMMSMFDPGWDGSMTPPSVGSARLATVVVFPFAMLVSCTRSEVGCGSVAKPSSGPVTSASVPCRVVVHAAMVTKEAPRTPSTRVALFLARRSMPSPI